MADADHRRRNAILAGGFLLTGLALAIFLSFLFSDRSPRLWTRRLVVRFSLVDGAAGIKPGSLVMLGGQPIGKVRSVRFDMDSGTSPARTGPDPGTSPARPDAPASPAGPAAGGGTPTGVVIDAIVRSDLAIYDNALIALDRPLLGTLSTLSMYAVGTRDGPHRGASPELEENEELMGTLAPPAFLAQAGWGPDQSAQLRLVMDRADRVSEKVASLVDRHEPAIDQGFRDLGALAGRFPAWGESADRTLLNLERASERFGPIGDEALAVVKSVRAVVEENRGAIDASIASAQKLMASLEGKSFDKLDEALAKVGRSAGRLDELLAEQGPTLRRTLANFRLMSDQLRLASSEIRTQPWRLLVRPTTKELEAQLVYDAARAYAEAVGDLRDASASLEGVLTPAQGAAPAGGETARVVPELIESLRTAFDRYRTREKEFLDLLIKQSGEKAGVTPPADSPVPPPREPHE